MWHHTCHKVLQGAGNAMWILEICGFYRSLVKVTIGIFFTLINTAIKYLLAIKQA